MKLLPVLFFMLLIVPESVRYVEKLAFLIYSENVPVEVTFFGDTVLETGAFGTLEEVKRMGNGGE